MTSVTPSNMVSQAKLYHTCTTDFLNVVTMGKNDGKLVTVVFWSTAKAFERVPDSKLPGYNNPCWLGSPFIWSPECRQNVNGTLSEHCLIASGAIQWHVPGSLPLLLHFSNIFYMIRHDIPFPFAHNLKTLDKFFPCALHSTLKITTLSSLESWCANRSIKFPARNNSTFTPKCHIPIESLEINKNVFPYPQTITRARSTLQDTTWFKSQGG